MINKQYSLLFVLLSQLPSARDFTKMCLIILVLLSSCNRRSKRVLELTLVFDKTVRISELAPVYINDSKVGRIEKIDFDKEVYAQIVFDEHILIDVESTFSLDQDLLGNSSIQITLAHGKTYLNSGDTVQVIESVNNFWLNDSEMDSVLSNNPWASDSIISEIFPEFSQEQIDSMKKANP